MIRVAVVGLGNMGARHARVLSELEGVELVAVVEPNDALRAAHRSSRPLARFADCAEMLAQCRPEAVVLAVPTALHCELSCLCLRAGAHVLVEKPIASSLLEADAMIACALETSRTLMVGHLERFNPAVAEIKRALDAGELGRVFQLHARRISAHPARIRDVGVALDMASHDIDVMLHLTGGDVVRAHAEIARWAQGAHEDMLAATLRFSTGAIGLLDVHWHSPQKIRQLTVVGEGGMYVADYLSQDVYFYKNGRLNTTWDVAAHFTGAVEGDMVRPLLHKREPLRVELEQFLSCIVHGHPPAVDAIAGRSALEVALRLQHASASL